MPAERWIETISRPACEVWAVGAEEVADGGLGGRSALVGFAQALEEAGVVADLHLRLLGASEADVEGDAVDVVAFDQRVREIGGAVADDGCAGRGHRGLLSLQGGPPRMGSGASDRRLASPGHAEDPDHRRHGLHRLAPHAGALRAWRRAAAADPQLDHRCAPRRPRVRARRRGHHRSPRRAQGGRRRRPRLPCRRNDLDAPRPR